MDLNEDKIDSRIDKIKERMHSVPFGMSNFQIKQFILDDETSTRKYRNALLQANNKIKALETARFNRDMLQVDLDEMLHNLEIITDRFEKRRILLNLDRKKQLMDDEMKIINDAALELATYISVIESMPEITREEFELAEKDSWERRLITDAKRDIQTSGNVSRGTIEALNQICLSIGRNEKHELIVTKYQPIKIEHKEDSSNGTVR